MRDPVRGSLQAPSTCFWVRVTPSSRSTEGPAPVEAEFTLIVRRDLHGAVLDTLARLPTRRSTTGTGDAERRFHYYRGGPHFDLCDGALVTGQGDEFRFVWHRTNGSVVRIVALNRERVPFTEEDRDLLLRCADWLLGLRGWSPDGIEAWKSRMRFEGSYPAWRKFVCGPAGSILVQRNRRVSETPFDQILVTARPRGGNGTCSIVRGGIWEWLPCLPNPIDMRLRVTPQVPG